VARAAVIRSPETLELDEIQGLVVRGYAHLQAARYVLLGIRDAAAARRFLTDTVPAITTAAARRPGRAVHLALTATGLRSLELPDAALAGFPPEFVEGLVAPARSRVLGDVDGSAPEAWEWGGPGTEAVDLLLLLYAADGGALEELARPIEAGYERGGVAEVHRLETEAIGDREHFGFRDGISQPIIAGLGRTGPAEHVVRAGEFVLGYANEYGLLTDRPLVPADADPAGALPLDPATGEHDLGRNGTFLVVRQMQQDVPGFWRFAREAAGGGDPVALASKMVGRWPSGAPLVEAPDGDDPRHATANGFAYANIDPAGLRCPIGAHVRRANPRDSLDPSPGTADSIAVNRRHRLLRRGRKYGPPADLGAMRSGSAPADGADRGLHFICVNANIARQFEFVQRAWVGSPKFATLYDDADPLIGRHSPSGGTFTIPARPVRQRVTGLPQFVTVRGGAYFFLPGIRALRYLGSLSP
jgi:Dyp-type peroxidase family